MNGWVLTAIIGLGCFFISAFIFGILCMFKTGALSDNREESENEKR